MFGFITDVFIPGLPGPGPSWPVQGESTLWRFATAWLRTMPQKHVDYAVAC